MVQIGSKYVIIPIGNFFGDIAIHEHPPTQVGQKGILFELDKQKNELILVQSNPASVGSKVILIPVGGDKNNIVAIKGGIPIVLAGTIFDQDWDTLSGITVYLTGDAEGEEISAADGSYRFYEAMKYYSYTVYPEPIPDTIKRIPHSYYYWSPTSRIYDPILYNEWSANFRRILTAPTMVLHYLISDCCPMPQFDSERTNKVGAYISNPAIAWLYDWSSEYMYGSRSRGKYRQADVSDYTALGEQQDVNKYVDYGQWHFRRYPDRSPYGDGAYTYPNMQGATSLFFFDGAFYFVAYDNVLSSSSNVMNIFRCYPEDGTPENIGNASVTGWGGGWFHFAEPLPTADGIFITTPWSGGQSKTWLFDWNGDLDWSQTYTIRGGIDVCHCSPPCYHNGTLYLFFVKDITHSTTGYGESYNFEGIVEFDKYGNYITPYTQTSRSFSTRYGSLSYNNGDLFATMDLDFQGLDGGLLDPDYPDKKYYDGFRCYRKSGDDWLEAWAIGDITNQTPAHDGAYIYITQDSKLKKILRSNGSTVWESAETSIALAPVIGLDGYIYTRNGNTILKYDSNGSVVESLGDFSNVAFIYPISAEQLMLSCQPNYNVTGEIRFVDT